MKTWTSSPSAFLDGSALTPPEFDAADLARFRTEFFMDGPAQQLMGRMHEAARQALATVGFAVADPLVPCIHPSTDCTAQTQDAPVVLERPLESGESVVLQAAFTLHTGPARVGEVCVELIARRRYPFMSHTVGSTAKGEGVICQQTIWWMAAPTDIKRLDQLSNHLKQALANMQAADLSGPTQLFASQLDRSAAP